VRGAHVAPVSDAVIVLDCRGFPLVVSTYTRAPTPEDFRDYEARMVGQVYARNQRFLSLADLSEIDAADATVRREGAAMAKRLEPEARELLIASVLVLPSPIQRHIITAVRWLSPPAYPERAVATRAEAAALAQGYLEEAGAPLTLQTRAALAGLRV
jgi:hypothetical protein